MNNNPLPPALLTWLLRKGTSKSVDFSIVEDFEEIYIAIAREKGSLRADFWYTGEVLATVFYNKMFSMFWSIFMLGNYFKISLRHLKNNKLYSLINISGLVAGLACSILMLMHIQYERNFDSFHENRDSIYRIVAEMNSELLFDSTPAMLAPSLNKDFPGIINSTRFIPVRKKLCRTEEKSFYETGIAFVDTSFLKMFTFSLVSGETHNVLDNPGSILITAAKAEEVFGDRNPVGMSIQVGDNLEFTISGIINNVPSNSHINFDYLAPFSAYKKIDNRLDDWGRYDFTTYIQIGDSVIPSDVAAGIGDYITRFKPESSVKLKMQALDEIHLISIGGTTYLYVFSIIAFVILFVACINFVNLSTARAGRKAKEVGLRKTIGAQKSDLIKQYLGESFLLTGISSVAAFILVYSVLPVFQNLSGKQVSFELLESLETFILLLVIIVFTGIVSGLYPAVFLSSYQPVSTLRDVSKYGKKRGSTLRKILVITQFTASSVLIVITLLALNQLDYIKNKNLGYEWDRMMYVGMNRSLFNQYQNVKSELQDYPGVLSVTASETLPTYMANWTRIGYWEGMSDDRRIKMNTATVDYNFLETFGIELTAGRNFDKNMSLDSKAFIINEEAVRQMGIDDPVGKRMKLWSSVGTIIGIVKNFHFRPLQQQIEPIILHLPDENRSFGNPSAFSYLCVKIKSDDLESVIGNVEKTFNKFSPDYPFEYGFLDNRIMRYYSSEFKALNTLGYSAFLSIFLSSIGLLGLVSFFTESRIKEISIRKVFGAKVSGIIFLIMNEFLILVTVSLVIALPAAYYINDFLLREFVYKAGFNVISFLTGSLITILIVIFTVSFQAVKTAKINSADALRHD